MSGSSELWTKLKSVKRVVERGITGSWMACHSGSGIRNGFKMIT